MMSTKHAMIPLLALLPLGLVACDETTGNAEGTDASTAGGTDAGRTDGGGLFGGGGNSGGGGGGGLFGGRGGSDESGGGSDAGSVSVDGGPGGGGGEDAGGGGGGGEERPDITPGPNVSQAQELVDALLQDYCELAAPCYGVSVDECLDYYGEETDYLVDLFSNAPLECLDALDSYSECGITSQECIDGELVEDETACESTYSAFEEACGEFFGEMYGGYYGEDPYEYGDDEPPFPDEEGDTFFECDDGGTIPSDWVCDGEADCEDATDEEGC
jgi:hypothetical protein